jgi:hypothetical protein
MRMFLEFSRLISLGDKVDIIITVVKFFGNKVQ